MNTWKGEVLLIDRLEKDGSYIIWTKRIEHGYQPLELIFDELDPNLKEGDRVKITVEKI